MCPSSIERWTSTWGFVKTNNLFLFHEKIEKKKKNCIEIQYGPNGPGKNIRRLFCDFSLFRHVFEQY